VVLFKGIKVCEVIVIVKVLAWDPSLISVKELNVIRIKAKVNYFKALRILSVLKESKGLIYS
jgi:hypothetical protein